MAWRALVLVLTATGCSDVLGLDTYKVQGGSATSSSSGEGGSGGRL